MTSDTVQQTEIVVPKRLDAPAVDGECADSAYAGDVVAMGRPGPTIRLSHSTHELFLCIEQIPLGARELIVLLDGGTLHRAPSESMQTLRVTADGQSSSDGWATVRAATVAGRSVWNAELATDLSGVGGFARAVGLRVALEGRTQAALEWPARSRALEPGSWARILLEPRFTSVRAGSAFLDGFGGHLVVPYDAGFSPRELTLETWVKVVDGNCGTIVSLPGRYRFGVCGTLRFRGVENAASVTGQIPLGNGWRHVAVTVNARGEQTLYVDGVVDVRAGWTPAHAEDRSSGVAAAVALPAATVRAPLRIGADPAADDGERYLHGYVRELRIWNRTLSADEIRRGAQTAAADVGAGLVARWPFLDGLADLVAGRDAGLIGDASPAAEAPEAPTPFPAPTTPTVRVAPAAPARMIWDGRLPLVESDITLDGICRPQEYYQAATIRLEPERSFALRALVKGDALYVCTGVLLGDSARSRLSIMVHGEPDAPSPDSRRALRLTLSGTGQLQIRPESARGRDSVEVRVFSAPTVALQDDMRPLDVPWWSAELRIPLAPLPGYGRATSRLRLGLAYLGEVSPQAARAHPELVPLLRASWPARVANDDAATWGAAIITAQSVVETPTVLADPVSMEIDPTAADFSIACPTGAQNDAMYATDSHAKWPKVDPSIEVVRAEGILTDLHISDEDSPFIHDSHDLDMRMTPRVQDRWLVLDNGDKLVLETESGEMPPHVRPLPGDHVVVIGRWIFDCGHAAKTEIHPIPVLATHRLETRRVLPDRPMQPVRVLRIWMNSSPGAFSYSFTGPFTFAAPLSATNNSELPFMAVVGGPSQPSIAVTATGAEVTVTPPASKGEFYWEIVLGQLALPSNVQSAAKPFRIRLHNIDFLDDLDAGAPDCGPLDNLSDCGEWYMDANINGVGKSLFANRRAWDEDNPFSIGKDFHVVGGNLKLHIAGYEDDDPLAGDDIGQSRGAIWDLGFLPTKCCGTTHVYTAPGGNYRLRYRVFDDAAPPDVLPPSSHAFWSSRTADEPNNIYSTAINLDTLTVPGPGSPSAITSRTSTLLESPFTQGGVRLLGTDQDRYRFSLSDFANVSPAVDVPGATLEIVPTSHWYISLPENLKEMIGFRSGVVHLTSPGGLGDRPYTLDIGVAYRPLPPDWGEPFDPPAEGRLVDLLTAPIAGGGMSPLGFPEQESRMQLMEWAWHHVPGDIDVYDIRIPKVSIPSMGLVFPCQYNQTGSLELRAYENRIVLPTLGIDSLNDMVIIGLNAKFPDGRVRARVEPPPGLVRGVYRLQTIWRNSVYHTPDQCAKRHAWETAMTTIAGLKAHQPLKIGDYGPGRPDPPPDAIDPALVAGHAYTTIQPGRNGNLSLDISSIDEHPVLLRLYDRSGVLVAESTTPRAASAAVERGTVAQLTATGLTTGETYLLQIVAPGASAPTLPLAINGRRW